MRRDQDTAKAEGEAMPETFDVCGQVGGPSAEEQARVDAEQLALVAEVRRVREAAAGEERARGADVDSKIERANQRAVLMQTLPDLVADLQQQVADLAAKVEEMTDGK
jgi:hypothetical protein